MSKKILIQILIYLFLGKKCSPIMKQYGFRWPATLDCDHLPKMSEQEKTGIICAAPPDTLNTPSDNFDDINLSNKKANDKDSLIKLTEVFPPPHIGIDLVEAKCDCKCIQPFIAINELNNGQSVLPHYNYQIQNVSNCAYSCHSEAINLVQDRAFINTWILIWFVCLIKILINFKQQNKIKNFFTGLEFAFLYQYLRCLHF